MTSCLDQAITKHHCEQLRNIDNRQQGSDGRRAQWTPATTPTRSLTVLYLCRRVWLAIPKLHKSLFTSPGRPNLASCTTYTTSELYNLSSEITHTLQSLETGHQGVLSKSSHGVKGKNSWGKGLRKSWAPWPNSWNLTTWLWGTSLSSQWCFDGKTWSRHGVILSEDPSHS